MGGWASHTPRPSGVDETVRRAIDNLGIGDPDENFGISEPSDYPSVKGVFDGSFRDLQVDDYVDVARRLVDRVLEDGCAPTSGGSQRHCLKHSS